MRYIDSRLIEALRAVLPPAAEVTPAPRGDRDHDVVVAGHALSAAWLGEGTPARLRRLFAALPARPDVVAAREFSPGARELLRDEGIGWVDETGAAEIAVGTIVVSRTGSPSLTRGPDARWTPAAMAVAEAILDDTPATVAAAIEATGYSMGACTKALAALAGMGLLTAEAARGPKSARRVVDRFELLQEYRRAVEAAPATVVLQVGITWQDPLDRIAALGRWWDGSGLAWAATGAAAAAVLAPHLGTLASATLYVDASTPARLEEVARSAGLRPLEGGRLTLRPFPTPAAKRLARETGGVRTAPWPRVYVDLLGHGVRGEDAAEHLLEVVGVV